MRRRILISCLLAVSLAGYGSGLRSFAAVQAARAVAQQEACLYQGLAAINPAECERYAIFGQAARLAFPVPGLAQGYVPQGLCYVAAIDCFAVSSYYPGGTRPSLLALVDASTGRRVKSLYLLLPSGLPYIGHGGGVAAWQEHLWVVSDATAYHLTVDDLFRAADGGYVRFRDQFRPGCRADVATCTGDILWVGEYCLGDRYATNPAHRDPGGSGNIGWCVGFRLDESSRRGLTALQNASPADRPIPDVILSLPDQVQGLTATTGGLLLLSLSGGIRPSQLLAYPDPETLFSRPCDWEADFAGQKRPVWVLDPAAPLARQILPPMSEGVAARGREVFVLFESAAPRYRDAAPVIADCTFALPERWILTAETPPDLLPEKNGIAAISSKIFAREGLTFMAKRDKIQICDSMFGSVNLKKKGECDLW
ncbi:MAG: hypothetical protein LBJ11_05260 [Oscillospiraceae bacterium]|nr:hypothetical protein [Oscillospiraceae bacterium]